MLTQQPHKLLFSYRSLFILLIGYLLLVFAIGGGSRADIASLIYLRPMAIVVCAIGLISLGRDQIRRYRSLFLMAVLLFGLTLSHLVPLPPGLINELPGREVTSEVAAIAGTEGAWRPLSEVPWATRNALFSLFIPFAVLLVGAQMSPVHLERLIVVILAIGLISGLIGILQVISGPSSSLYFYRVTNSGAAVGLFSNRNHQALLLATMFPMLAVWASAPTASQAQSRFRYWLAIVLAAPLVPLLLVTGSRAGLALGGLGIAAAFFLYRQPSHREKPRRMGAKRIDLRIPLGLTGAASLILMTVVASRSEAISRLLQSDAADEGRLAVWKPILKAAWDYFPLGSGIGSFVEVYQLHEPNALIGPSYFNHAHNDYLEIFLTAGLPGLALLALATIGVLKACAFVWRRRRHTSRYDLLARLGLVIILQIALASIVDYPVRTPSIAALLVVASLWVVNGRLAAEGARTSDRARDPT